MGRARLKIEVALDQYYKEHVALKVVARRRTEFAFDALKGFFGVDGPEYVQEIDIPACREYRVFRADVCDATVRRELGVLQAAVNHAIKWRRLMGVTLDKMPSIELPAATKVRPIWLFKPELSKLLEVAEREDHRVLRFCQIAYHTASRKRAVETLPWRRVDLEARRIDLQNPDEPVTKKRRPIVPVSSSMVEELRLMLSTSDSPFVLGSDQSITRAFEKTAAAAGLLDLQQVGLREAGRLTPHILRHTRATHLLQDGKSPWTVANLLGDSLETVMRVYGHACPDYLDGALS